jgi:hypothetical protein
MDHAHAIETNAAERYLLGELSLPESQEFELHFFACEECAADVESGTILIENVRALGRETQQSPAEPRPAPQISAKKGWRELLAGFRSRPFSAAPALAAAALAVLAGYQALVTVPRLRRELSLAAQPRQLPAFALLGATRGSPIRIAIPPDTRFFALNFDPVWTAGFPAYRCDVVNSAGAVKASAPVSAPPAGHPVTLLLASDDIPRGSYVLVVQGIGPDSSRVEVARYAFSVE